MASHTLMQRDVSLKPLAHFLLLQGVVKWHLGVHWEVRVANGLERVVSLVEAGVAARAVEKTKVAVRCDF